MEPVTQITRTIPRYVVYYSEGLMRGALEIETTGVNRLMQNCKLDGLDF